MISVNVSAGVPGDNRVSVRVDGEAIRSWRSSALRGDFDQLHTEAHRIAGQLATEFLDTVVCRWCEVRAGEGEVR